MADNQDKKAVIFVTARNCEPYIANAIESLRAQTIQNFEILMVDDASTDATGDIAEEVLEREFGDRFTFFRNPAHIGKAANAYKYLRQVEGDYVAILDGDDAVIDCATAGGLNGYDADKRADRGGGKFWRRG